MLSNQDLPKHIGIIMDGNGRWAKQRGLIRTAGHKEGLKAAKRVTKRASELGIKYLSLYAFSTENWKRTEDEVSFLMGLIKNHLKKEYKFYKENSIRVVHSGDLQRLPQDVQDEILTVENETASFDELTVNLAINYGGQDEIIRSVNQWVNKRQSGEFLDASTLEKFLDVPMLPPADLIIRTSGEQRMSNFLLWRSAYSELVFSEKYWPDWHSEDLDNAIKEFSNRKRRFGEESP